MSSGREIVIVEEGDLRKYRIEIPNIVDDMGLSPYELRLYVHIKRRAGAGEGGTCREGTRRMAAVCKMSIGQVSQAKQKLKEAGLINVELGVGPSSPDVITITDIWPKNFRTYARAKGCPPNEQGVHTVNSMFTERTQGRSYSERKKKHEYKKELQKKEPHTKRLAQASPSRVCVRSKFSQEECRQYVDYLVIKGEKIKNPGGFATVIRRSGEADEQIERFFTNPPRDEPWRVHYKKELQGWLEYMEQGDLRRERIEEALSTLEQISSPVEFAPCKDRLREVEIDLT